MYAAEVAQESFEPEVSILLQLDLTSNFRGLKDRRLQVLTRLGKCGRSVEFGQTQRLVKPRARRACREVQRMPAPLRVVYDVARLQFQTPNARHMKPTLTMTISIRQSLLALFALFCLAPTAESQIIFEDFLDGAISDDSGLVWSFDGQHAVSEDGLLLTSLSGSPLVMSPFDTDIAARAWSVRMQVRFQNSGTLGVEVQNAWATTSAIIDAQGALHLNSNAVEASAVGTRLRPTVEDVVLQVDYINGFNEGLTIQAWLAGQNPSVPADHIGGTYKLSGIVEDPIIRLEAESDLFHGELRWLAFMPNDRMPLNIPYSLLQLDCSFDVHYTDAGFFDGTVSTAEDILGVDDIECSTERTIQPLLDQIRVLAGDANLDGQVDFSDFLRLSANFGLDGNWADGDFDKTGRVQFSDFLLLSQNMGKSAPTVPVPEPELSLVMLLGAFGIVRSRF